MSVANSYAQTNTIQQQETDMKLGIMKSNIKDNDLTNGETVLSLLKYVEERCAPDVLAYIMEKEQYIGLPLQNIDGDSWYSTVSFNRLLECITDRAFDGDARRCVEIGSYLADRDMNGIYKAFLFFVSEKMVLKAWPRIFKKIHKGSSLKVVQSDSKSCTIVVIRDAGGSAHEWYTIIGATMKPLEEAGAENIQYEIKHGVTKTLNTKSDGYTYSAEKELRFTCKWL